MVPDIIKNHLVEKLGIQAQGYSAASGGCINSGGTIETNQGRFFIKWNSASRYPEMFEKEAAGLRLLFDTNTIRTPKVVHVAETGNLSFILMENIDRGRTSADYWQSAGGQLADMHRRTDKCYGLDEDNYIGSLHQINTHKDVWTTFFIENRLEPQIRLAMNNGLLDQKDLTDFERLFAKLPSIIPASEPSLIHGDLWSGNIITDEQGMPCLIDPAVYYGNREIEIAYTQLFGGFDREFYTSYHEEYPLDPGFDTRVDLYNLYPLLVHVNLFGSGYSASVRRNLQRYI